MKHLVVLGAGTVGTMVANRMVRRLPAGWDIVVVDPESQHLYQPGLLFLPFGARDESKTLRPRQRPLASGVRWIRQSVETVDPGDRRVVLDDGATLALRSVPAPLLLWTSVAVTVLAVAVPFREPFARVFGFVALPWPLLGAMVAIVVGYVVATEFAKRRFYRGREPR